MSIRTTYQTVPVSDRTTGGTLNIFFRAAGPADAPAILLLHGFPSSSHQYRGLIDRLADKYHVIAPDLPGFGFSDAPPPTAFDYTFDHLAEVIESFTDAIGLKRYALYIFDYGAPVGFRLAAARPERVTALISQNGNAYEEGLSEGWNPIQAYWQDPSAENRAALQSFLTPETTRFQYTHGVSDPALVAPESYTLDQHFLDRPGNSDIQLDLFGDYKNNVAAYPRFQDYLRTHQPPTLAVWGRNDPFFIPPGAEAFRRDNPRAEVHIIDAGHFVLESNLDEVAELVRAFLGRTIDAAQGPILFDSTNEMSPATKDLLAATASVFGFTPSLAVALATEPSALRAYVAMLQALGESTLDPLAQQVALVAASRANAADYGVATHATLAAKLGASAELEQCLRSGARLTDPKLEAVRRFATAVAVNRTQVSDSDVNALRAVGYDSRAMVAIALAAAAKTLVNAVAHLARTPIDPGFLPKDARAAD